MNAETRDQLGRVGSRRPVGKMDMVLQRFPRLFIVLTTRVSRAGFYKCPTPMLNGL
jgi:hypothetical protein